MVQSEDGIFSIFVKNSIVTIYKDYKFLGVFPIVEEGSDDAKKFVPLQLVSTPELTLVAKVGDSLRSYKINLDLLSSEQFSVARIDDTLKSFSSSTRSLSLVILNTDKHIQIVDPLTLKLVHQDVGQI